MKEKIIKDSFVGGIVTTLRPDLIADGKTPDCNNILPFIIGTMSKRPGMAQVDDIDRLKGTNYSYLYLNQYNTLADGYIVYVADGTNGITEIYQYIPRIAGCDVTVDVGDGY